MRHTLRKLREWKNAFELLADAKLINLDDHPKYWAILDDIDSIFKKYHVVIK